MWTRTILGLAAIPLLLAMPGCSRSPRATPGSAPSVDVPPPVAAADAATADAAAGADASNAVPAPADATSSPPVIVDPELARRIEEAARSTEPFVCWLRGDGDERPGPPAVLAEVVADRVGVAGPGDDPCPLPRQHLVGLEEEPVRDLRLWRAAVLSGRGRRGRRPSTACCAVQHLCPSSP